MSDYHTDKRAEWEEWISEATRGRRAQVSRPMVIPRWLYCCVIAVLISVTVELGAMIAWFGKDGAPTAAFAVPVIFYGLMATCLGLYLGGAGRGIRFTSSDREMQR